LTSCFLTKLVYFSQQFDEVGLFISTISRSIDELLASPI